ncbi:MAG: hypothetical protein IPL79_15270 [Myxococcales bacterium]|nr:hypothetical protein [Myxococcales bacterium]
MSTSSLRPRTAATLLLAAVVTSATVPIEAAHAHRGSNLTQRIAPSIASGGKARAGDLPSNSRTKLRAGATAVGTAKPAALAAQVKRRTAKVSLVRLAKPALGAVITALSGALTAASAYVAGWAITEAFTSNEPVIFAAAFVVTAAYAFFSALMTGAMGKATIDLTRDALR